MLIAACFICWEGIIVGKLYQARITFDRLTKRHGGLTVGFVVVDDGSTSYLVSWYKAQHYQGIVFKQSNFSVFD